MINLAPQVRIHTVVLSRAQQSIRVIRPSSDPGPYQYLMTTTHYLLKFLRRGDVDSDNSHLTYAWSCADATRNLWVPIDVRLLKNALVIDLGLYVWDATVSL